MNLGGVVLEDCITDLARKDIAGFDDSRLEPVVDQESGRPDGYVVASAFERVMVMMRASDSLSLADVSHLRRLMARVQARRALLYVTSGAVVANSVMLLATLSRIQIVRIARA